MTTEADIDGQLERLVRNTDRKITFMKKHENGSISLYNAADGQGISYGNTKRQMYWELVTANRILELLHEKQAIKK